jgi:DNA-binding NarL/FixJ family response regulator
MSTLDDPSDPNIWETAGVANPEGGQSTPQSFARSTTTHACMKSVLLIDHSSMMRQSLEGMLQHGTTDFLVTGASSVNETIDLAPSLVILNIWSAHIQNPDVVGQFQAIRGQLVGPPAVAVISELDEPSIAIEAIRYGCRGYLPTSLSLEMTAVAIQFMLGGGTFLPASVISYCTANRVLPLANTDVDVASSVRLPTTNREREVIRLLRLGRPNKMIAHELGISESTVKIHIRNIMHKLGATNRTQAACFLQGHAHRTPNDQYDRLFEDGTECSQGATEESNHAAERV